MTAPHPPPYTTNLAKAQGLVKESLELLGIWTPGMTAAELLASVKETGALGLATDTRVTDVVTRGFAQRYLIEDGRPAQWIQFLMQQGANRQALRQIMLIYTARHNAVLHDFITSVYWRKATGLTSEITKADTRDFLERAVLLGRIQPRWADSMMERVTRYLLGTLEDFQMISENRSGNRKATPPAIQPETVLFLAYDLHFHAIEESALPVHPDWALFGLDRSGVIHFLEKEASKGHLQVQNAGPLLRIEWHYPDMNSVLHAITH